MKEDELKEIFLAEALEGYEELNQLFTALEKDHSSKRAIDAIFRITHTLKANAAGMGFEDIAEMSHTLEDVFSEIRGSRLQIEEKLFNDLFKSNDALGAMIQRVKNPANPMIKFKGIKTKLEVMLRVARFGPEALPQAITESKKPDIIVEEAQLNKQAIPETVVEIKEVEKKEESKISIPELLGESLTTQIPKYTDNQENTLEANTIDEPEVELEVESKVAFSDLVQIPVRKLDNLMNLVGELMIERDRVMTIAGATGSGRNNAFSRFQRITSELQYSVMDARLVQVNILFSKFHRIVRDTAALENKKVNLLLEGTENEIDRNVLQIISESLVHVVRNAISHGIEQPNQRIKLEKPEFGTVTISAKSEKDSVIIEVKDDGKGIDPKIILKKAIEKGLVNEDLARLLSEEEILQFIFEPGFSSVDEVTAVSGRGVGMDVVKRSLDSIGGKVNISTRLGEGTVISLTLPSSMALKAALLFLMGNSEFAIPLNYTDAVIQILPKDIHKVGRGLVANHLKKTISIVFLQDLFALNSLEDINTNNVLQMGLERAAEGVKLYVIVVSYGSREVGFVVDKLLQQKEIVEKPLAKPLENTAFFSGATILGNGNVCLALDIPSVMNKIFKNIRK
ncbi:MAG: chemotaxis protein CheA [Cytophagales bacterium]